MNTSIDGVESLLDGLRALRGAVGDRRRAVAGFVRINPARDAVAHRDEHAERRRAACIENASRTTSRGPPECARALTRITISPPARYKPTFSGESRSAARPIDLIPPMMTSHVSTATRCRTTLDTPNTLLTTSAIEFGCVNGVVVSAATPRRARTARRGPAIASRRAGSTSGPKHRPAANLPERQAERGLRELDRHGHEPVHPDPEEGAGTARDDRRRHARDVAGADRRRQRGHERLKRRQRTRPCRALAARTRSTSLAESANLHDTACGS